MSRLIEDYNWLIHDISDPRVKEWPFMSGPWGILAVIGLYVYAVYYYLPKYMEYRKPYDLKTIITLYNILQVCACTYLIYGVATSGWTTHYSFGCQPIDYSNNKMAVRMAGMVWWTFMLKMAELVETVFFSLRKKNNQISPLHVYHHISTLLFVWIGAKYINGGMATFSVMVNCFVHILMYTYYLLAAMGPNMQRRLVKWKPKLTMIQMIQFWIVVFHAAQALKSDCHVPKFMAYVFIPNVGLIFYMFLKFYIQSYMQKRRRSSVK